MKTKTLLLLALALLSILGIVVFGILGNVVPALWCTLGTIVFGVWYNFAILKNATEIPSNIR